MQGLRRLRAVPETPCTHEAAEEGCQAGAECRAPALWAVRFQPYSETYRACRGHLEPMLHENTAPGGPVIAEVRLRGTP